MVNSHDMGSLILFYNETTTFEKLLIATYRGLFQGCFAHISKHVFTYSMLFVRMYFMYIMYMHYFCTFCTYATFEWPEFYVNKDMFCFVLTFFKVPIPYFTYDNIFQTVE